MLYKFIYICILYILYYYIVYIIQYIYYICIDTCKYEIFQIERQIDRQIDRQINRQIRQREIKTAVASKGLNKYDKHISELLYSQDMHVLLEVLIQKDVACISCVCRKVKVYGTICVIPKILSLLFYIYLPQIIS